MCVFPQLRMKDVKASPTRPYFIHVYNSRYAFCVCSLNSGFSSTENVAITIKTDSECLSKKFWAADVSPDMSAAPLHFAV